MFGKFREKLKNWIKGSSEKVEETAQKIEKTSTEDDKKVEEKGKEEDKKLSAAKKDPVEILSEQPVEKVIEVLEEDKSAIEVVEKIKEVKKEAIKKEERFDKIIQDAKKESGKEPPMKFNIGKQKFEPDIEKIKEEVEEIKKDESSESVEKKSIFSKIKSTFSYKIGEGEFNEIFDELEMLLLENNVALEVVEYIRKNLSKNLIGMEINKDEIELEIKNGLKKSLNEILIEPDNPLEIIKEKKDKPFVILFFGVNGTGKTTSIAKISHFLKKSGISVVLAAGDTFRAASIEQISEHAEKIGVPLIKHNYGSDSAAVGFDAIKYAKKHRIDVVLIDSAGRMHTKTNLMSEMEKIVRVVKPDLKIFVAESIAGNDAVEQARSFHEEFGIDGSILSKVDIDEKGGTIISVSYATKKPIFYLGVGQNYEDLRLFNKEEFIENLLGD